MKQLATAFGLVFALAVLRDSIVFLNTYFLEVCVTLAVTLLGWFAFSYYYGRYTRELLSQVPLITRSEFVRGHRIKTELGWVSASGCDTTDEFERALRMEAAKIGANAIVRSHWRKVGERYQAGRSKQGNPYYKNRIKYDGEGLAVRLVKISRQTRDHQNRNRELVEHSSAGYGSGWLALDGNNLFGKALEDAQTFEGALEIMRRFLQKLQTSPYKYHVFWDSKFAGFAMANGAMRRGERLPVWLSVNLGIQQTSITLSDRGQRADDLIVAWAHSKSAAVISNDNYNKDYEDDLIRRRVSEIKRAHRLFKFNVIAGEIIVPELTHL